MTAIANLEDIETLSESIDLECKAAQGRDGKGEHPASVWETYSAMANTPGGEIFLGIGETSVNRFVNKEVNEPVCEFYQFSSVKSGALNSPDLRGNSPDLTVNSPDLKTVLHDYLGKMGYSQTPGKMDSLKFRELIRTLCAKRWLNARELAELLDRDAKNLKIQYLSSMISDGELEYRFPETENHPNQAYRTKEALQ